MRVEQPSERLLEYFTRVFVLCQVVRAIFCGGAGIDISMLNHRLNLTVIRDVEDAVSYCGAKYITRFLYLLR